MKNILTFCFILSAFVSFAQNRKIDSLQQALKEFDTKKTEPGKHLFPDERDTAKVNILNALSRQFWMVSDYANANSLAAEALSLAQQIGFRKGIAASYQNTGIINSMQGNYPEALKNHVASLKISEDTRDKNGIASAYNNIGIIYSDQGNYTEALKNHFASLKIREETGDKNGIASSYNNIGNIYGKQGNYADALNYYFNSLKISEETGILNDIAKTYTNIGNIYADQGNYPEALKNYFAALAIKEEGGDKSSIANSYNNIGLIYHSQGNYPEALKNYFYALQIRQEIGDKYGLAESHINIGNAKVKMKETREGKDWLMKGLHVAKELEALSLLRDGYEYLARADSVLELFKSAFENQKLFILYRDSLNSEEATKKTLQIKMQHEFEKKEAATKATIDAELNKQKLVRNGFIVGFVAVLLIAGVFLRQRNKTKKEQMRAEEEKKRSEELLLNILPGEVASEIKNTGTAKAKAFTMVTVMFTDFKDFTKVSEKISAELLVDEIHACFSAFDNILHKYGIEKIKTIGDAYLCASGLPVSNYTHAVDMLNAAFEIRNFMLERKKEKEAKGEIVFELRIGIHTGPVVAGVVGVKKYAYDIWGDTVNIAARMEQNSEAGKINISGATYELVKDKLKCTHRGKIQAKNKGEIDMYFVEQFS